MPEPDAERLLNVWWCWLCNTRGCPVSPRTTTDDMFAHLDREHPELKEKPMADEVSGDALDRAQKIFNAMKDEPDSTGKIAVLAEALERTEAEADPTGKIRVLRVLEYVYADVQMMTTDMANWQVQGQFRPSDRLRIRSSVVSQEVLG